MSVPKLRELLTGRKIEVIDQIMFYLTKKQYSQWFLSNRLYHYWIRKKKHISNLPFLMICGFPRSGTTLLQMLINACYYDIKGPYEERNPFDLYINRKETASIFTLDYNKVEKMWNEVDHDIIKFCEHILHEYSRNNNIRIVVLKSPTALMLLDKLFYHFPCIKVIHIIRDGRDAVLSAMNYLSKFYNENFSFEWCTRQWVAYMKFAQKYKDNKNYLAIKYEDLVYDPYDVLDQISVFLNTKPPDVTLLSDYISKLNKNKIPITHRHQIVKGIYDSSIGRYKKEINEKQARYFKNIAYKVLLELGYELE